MLSVCSRSNTIHNRNSTSTVKITRLLAYFKQKMMYNTYLRPTNIDQKRDYRWIFVDYLLSYRVNQINEWMKWLKKFFDIWLDSFVVLFLGFTLLYTIHTFNIDKYTYFFLLKILNWKWHKLLRKTAGTNVYDWFIYFMHGKEKRNGNVMSVIFVFFLVQKDLKNIINLEQKVWLKAWKREKNIFYYRKFLSLWTKCLKSMFSTENRVEIFRKYYLVQESLRKYF